MKIESLEEGYRWRKIIGRTPNHGYADVYLESEVRRSTFVAKS